VGRADAVRDYFCRCSTRWVLEKQHIRLGAAQLVWGNELFTLDEKLIYIVGAGLAAPCGRMLHDFLKLSVQAG
jgi:hypothetical protein